jgi:hypothetical protein
VGLLRNEASCSGVNIFGYGVRGKDNFQFALSLASDLGFKKVCCVLDKGDAEDSIVTNLKQSFPNYKILQWNKGDIRDKDIYTSTEKKGYFRSDGTKKDSSELDDFDTKIAEVKTYLDL